METRERANTRFSQARQAFRDAVTGALSAGSELLGRRRDGDLEAPEAYAEDIGAELDTAELGDKDEDIDISTDRFVYEPKSLPERLLVGGRVKSRLSTSKCVKIPYRAWCKYLLILFLVLLGAFFTPHLVPKWLGFEWATPKDLCQNSDEKLGALKTRIENLTNLAKLENYYEHQKFDLQCLNTSAANFYKAPERFQWPDECTPEKASESLEDEVCVGPIKKGVCDNIGGIRKFFASLAQTCKTVTIPKKCVTSVDSERTEALLELEREQNAQVLNDTITETQPIVQTANDKATEIINRILVQVDIASDIYIAYSIVALIIGMPLIIYKREKGSRILGATFGMTKLTFIIIVVVFLSMYESFLLILKETDFSRIFRNFRNDPCYVDADFSRERVNLIIYTCNNVTQLGANSSYTLQDMDNVYFTTRRFALCKDDNREPTQHPREGDMDALRKSYRDGELEFPGSCNATYLDEETSTAPEDPEFSKLRALLGSGVIAQLFVKFIMTSWLVHLMAYFEPMIVHNGKVEIWDTAVGAKDGGGKDEMPLNEREVLSATRFARDKHLLPMIFMSALMVVEVGLIAYSMVVTHSGKTNLLMMPDNTALPTDFICPFQVR